MLLLSPSALRTRRSLMPYTHTSTAKSQKSESHTQLPAPSQEPAGHGEPHTKYRSHYTVSHLHEPGRRNRRLLISVDVCHLMSPLGPMHSIMHGPHTKMTPRGGGRRRNLIPVWLTPSVPRSRALLFPLHQSVHLQIRSRPSPHLARPPPAVAWTSHQNQSHETISMDVDVVKQTFTLASRDLVSMCCKRRSKFTIIQYSLTKPPSPYRRAQRPSPRLP